MMMMMLLGEMEKWGSQEAVRESWLWMHVDDSAQYDQCEMVSG